MEKMNESAKKKTIGEWRVKKKGISGWSAPSKRIKDVLKEKGMTQKMLAERLSNSEGKPLSEAYVKQLLNKPSLTTDVLNQIAKALGVELWELFISSDEAVSSKGEVCAFIKYKGIIYNPLTLEDLKKLANELLPDEPKN